MSIKIVIVHQWHGSPESDWYPWLKEVLEKKGFEVVVPEMPDTDSPKIDSWVSHLQKAVAHPTEKTYFVGHSVGCQTILRYLERLDPDMKVGGVLLVAPWLTLKEEALGEELPIARPWLDTKISWEKVMMHTDSFVAIMSGNDPYVPLNNGDMLGKFVNAKVLVQPNAGHFEKEGGFAELDVALKELLKIMRQRY